jgi:hypothetical protein
MPFSMILREICSEGCASDPFPGFPRFLEVPQNFTSRAANRALSPFSISGAGVWFL